jgi:hypothetical protein
LSLLDRARAEGLSDYRRAVLLFAITRVARINLEEERLRITVLEGVPRQIRKLVQPELRTVVNAIAMALDDLARLPFLKIGLSTQEKSADRKGVNKARILPAFSRRPALDYGILAHNVLSGE